MPQKSSQNENDFMSIKSAAKTQLTESKEKRRKFIKLKKFLLSHTARKPLQRSEIFTHNKHSSHTQIILPRAFCNFYFRNEGQAFEARELFNLLMCVCVCVCTKLRCTFYDFIESEMKLM